MKIMHQDRAAIPVTSHREYTENGYLKVPGRVARVGIQSYLASELGIEGRPPNDVVNVYRPGESVFDPESLATYDNADITVEHPSQMVDAKSYPAVSVGHAVSPGRPEGDYVVVDLLIKSQEAIDAIEGGKAELSAGYLAEYLPETGTAPTGESYEFIQRGIAVNHIALCDQARAGRLARLFDHQSAQEAVMTHKVTLDNGIKVEVADEATQSLIQSTLDGLRKRVADAEEAKQETQDEKEKAEAKADASDEENEELKKKSSEDAISKRVSEVLAVTDSARKLAGAEFTCDSVAPMEIKRAAMAALKPKREWADKSAAYIEAAFDEAVERQEEEDEDGEKEKGKTTDSHRKFSEDLSNVKTGDAQATTDAAYQASMDRKANAWKEAQ